MVKCRKRRKMCKTRCRARTGRFKKCRPGDRRYTMRNLCRRKSRCRRRKKSRCRRRSSSRYMWRCRNACGRFKRCARCERRWKLRKRCRGNSETSGSEET